MFAGKRREHMAAVRFDGDGRAQKSGEITRRWLTDWS
jgi:hypothetical protein